MQKNKTNEVLNRILSLIDSNEIQAIFPADELASWRLMAAADIVQPQKATKGKGSKAQKAVNYLSIVKTVIGARSALPILNCIAVKSGIAQGTNLEQALTFPAPDGTVDGIYDIVGGKLLLNSGLALEDFPPTYGPCQWLADGNPVETLSATGFNGVELAEALTALFPMVSTDVTRYKLNGVYFSREAGSEVFTLVATDGRRLHYRTLQSSGTGEMKFILPSPAIKTLLKINPAEKVEFTLSAPMYPNEKGIMERGENQSVLIDLPEGGELVSKCIEGTFPNYRQVIPLRDGDKIHFSVDSQKWELVLKELLPIAKHCEQDTIRLDFHKAGSVTFKICPADSGIGITERVIEGASVDCWEAFESVKTLAENEPEVWEEKPSDTLTICFNLKFLSDIIKTQPDMVRLSDNLSPACFYRTADVDNRHGESILMSIRIR
ncbi:DNA polymerase III subunit beta [Gammaproteobacteria bacterium]